MCKDILIVGLYYINLQEDGSSYSSVLRLPVWMREHLLREQFYEFGHIVEFRLFPFNGTSPPNMTRRGVALVHFADV